MALRYGCYRCDREYKDIRECQRHHRLKHPAEHGTFKFQRSLVREIVAGTSAPSATPSSTLPITPAIALAPAAPPIVPVDPALTAHWTAPLVAPDSTPPSLTALPLSTPAMEETSGRGHREKIPSAKVKEQVHKALDKNESTSTRKNVPVYVASRDPRFELEQKEIPKIYDHSKIGPSGEITDWYTLGNHVESKDKRTYIRAKRDPETMYFHTAEAPPHRARLSDENHCQCAVDNLYSVFSKDMMAKSGELGSFTSRANVFAREGQFFWEAKVISQADSSDPSTRHLPLAMPNAQSTDKTKAVRGQLRVGFCRRETLSGEPIGSSAYSYALTLRGGPGREYGPVRFHSLFFHMKGKDIDDLAAGDVVGLMITLPSLDIHKKVVHGVFDPTEHPDLECGPAKPKARSKTAKKKVTGKEVDPVKVKAKGEDEWETERTLIRSTLRDVSGLSFPIDHDIIRDRNPFIHKNGPCYFECPEYTIRPDLDRPTNVTRLKSINPDDGKIYKLEEAAHPLHELPHLRTLPGSKIEVWVNGKYHGILWEHLLAFLPPASHIDTTKSRTSMAGEVDDGLLGYYPAVSHFTGGAVECKFDGPWWYGYDDGPARPPARAMGERYNEQIVEDVCADIVDEVYLERLHKDRDWMKNEVMKAAKIGTKERD